MALDYDLVVAGAGPAGLCAALRARQHGMSVAVLDPRPGAQDKACGEGLMPATLTVLERLGVTLDGGHPFEGIRYVQGRHEATARFREGPGLGVRRTELSRVLLEAADRAGVERIERRVTTIDQTDDEVRVEGLRARALFVADGLRSRLRDALGLSIDARRYDRLGVRWHFEVQPWSPYVEVHWSDTSEAYVTPVGPGLVGVALLSLRGGHTVRKLGEAFPCLAERTGPPVEGKRGAGPFEQRVKRRVQGRVALIGDAAGYLDPMTGEGIRLGAEGAMVATDLLASDRLEQWEPAWWRLTRRYRFLTGALLAASQRPRLRRHLVPLCDGVPGVMNTVVNLLGATPRHLRT